MQSNWFALSLSLFLYRREYGNDTRTHVFDVVGQDEEWETEK